MIWHVGLNGRDVRLVKRDGCLVRDNDLYLSS